MSDWKSRPPEIASLLNPAFIAVLIRDLAAEYPKTANKPLPIEIPFLCLPLTLHSLTRSSLPKSTGKRIEPWWEENGQLRIGFIERVHGLAQPAREGLILGGQAGFFSFSKGCIIKGSRKLNRAYWQPTQEMKEIQKAVRFVGRWFGPHSSVEVFSIFGVRP